MLLIFVLSVILAVSSARTVNYALNRNIELVFDTETFTCTTAGIFPDPVNNTKFYYCISDGNGFISAHIDCSPGYRFNAKSEGCVPKPRNEVSTIQPGSTDTLGPAITLTEIYPTKPPGTTETTTEGVTVTTTEGTTTTEDTTLTPTTGPTESTTLAPFVCPGPGPFPDPFSKNHYYYCIPDNGEGFIPIKITCGTGSEYIPEIGTCGIPGETGTTTEHPGTGGTTTEPQPYECTGEGLFPDPLDKSKFYYCLPDGEGGYIPIQLSCGQGMEFVPELGGCGISEGSSTTTESPQQFQCPGEGAFPNPDDVGSYYFCFADGEGGYIGVLLTCSTGQVFDPEAGQCVEIDQSTTESPQITTPVPFMCPDIGVFPDPTDKTKFYYCIKNPDETGYRATLFTCSLGQIFDEAKGYCSASSDKTSMTEKDLTISNSFTTDTKTTEATTTEALITVTATTINAETTEAPVTVTVTTTNVETTAAATTEPGCNTQPARTPMTTTSETTTNGSEETTVIASTTPAPFNCTADGLFPDPTDDTNFYFCMYDGFGYISITLQCSTGMVFIPILARCAPPDTPIPPPAPVNCTSVGYLASPDNCQDYYYCYSNFKGGYLTIKHTCPNNTHWFEPMQICVDNVQFQCDKGISTTITTTISTAATITTNQPIHGFQCTQAGKFPYRGDDRKYYECIYKGSGEFEKKTNECPRWHRFSQYYQSCVRDWWFWW